MNTLIAPTFLIRTATPPPCTNDPELFHPNDDGRTERGNRPIKRATDAIELCLDCPLMLACRDWAREHREYGIWGAETDEERTAAGHAPKLPAVRVKPECGTPAGAQWHRRYGNGTPCVPCRAAEAEARRKREREHRTNEVAVRLYPQEMRVLEELSRGLTAEEIAQQPRLTRKTVLRCLSRLRKALGVENNELVDAGRAAGLLPAIEYARAA
ncbi:WhiB family transcriptional regulator [Streptomyces sp. NPDC054933]